MASPRFLGKGGVYIFYSLCASSCCVGTILGSCDDLPERQSLAQLCVVICSPMSTAPASEEYFVDLGWVDADEL